MKTVKRKANVGERILITNRVEGSIKNGDIGVVTKVDDDLLNADIRGQKRPVYDDEYEVIVENETDEKFAIEHLEGLGITAVVTNPGSQYTTYVDFAKASGYPDYVVNGNATEKSTNGDALRGETVNVLAKGKHGQFDNTIYVVQSQDGERFLFGEYGLEIKKNGIIAQMQAEIETLKNRVGVLENIQKAGNIELPKPITEQQRRDKIIEKARCDVLVLKSKLKDRYALHLVYENGHLGVSFIINREKRTIVALLDGLYCSIGRKIKGIAKCAPDDCFNVHIGKAIALRRALGLEVPFEYLHVPQPTEVRVGDIVKASNWFDDTPFKVNKIVNKRVYDRPGYGWITLNSTKIIDDSHEEVTE